MNLFHRLTTAISLFLITSVSFAVDKKSPVNNVNSCYQSIAQAYKSLDAQEMTDVYTPDGIYLSTSGALPIIQGQPNLYQLYNNYFNRVKNHNSSLDLQFRVINRLTAGNTVHDVGYYMVTIIPPQHSQQPPKQHAGKFMVTFKLQANGRWGVWSEATSKSDLTNYINAKKVTGLHFDDYFSANTYSEQH